MKILHIVHSLDDERPLATARAQAREHQVTVLLLHDAVLRQIDIEKNVELLAGLDDANARGGLAPYANLDYVGIVRAVFEHDLVISW